jgi:N-acetyl-gamma-glutamyl-phosphate reductase
MFKGHDTWIEAIDSGSELALFSAAPHGLSAAMIAGILERLAIRNITTHVVDASADFRFKTSDAYAAVYGKAHEAQDLLDSFSSGLPEHVVGAPTPHIGNPGCFATSMLLALVPMLQSGKTDAHFFVSAVTGSTGSGRIAGAGTHHPERNSNLYAYKPLAHRHAPEVCEMTETATGIQPKLHFVPHSGPFARGIHATVQARLTADSSSEDMLKHLADFYANAPFVRVSETPPRIKNVVASNYADISVAVEDGTVVVMVAIDNLVKGAAGGAMQWMNRLWALPETAGIDNAAPAWT